MRRNDNVVEPHLDWNERSPAITLEVDQERARALGLTPEDMAATLQTLLTGTAVTTVRDGREQVDVVARAVPDERLALGRIEDLSILTRSGVPVPWRRSPRSVSAMRTRYCGDATATWRSLSAAISSTAFRRRT